MQYKIIEAAEANVAKVSPGLLEVYTLFSQGNTRDALTLLNKLIFTETFYAKQVTLLRHKASLNIYMNRPEVAVQALLVGGKIFEAWGNLAEAKEIYASAAEINSKLAEQCWIALSTVTLKQVSRSEIPKGTFTNYSLAIKMIFEDISTFENQFQYFIIPISEAINIGQSNLILLDLKLSFLPDNVKKDDEVTNLLKEALLYINQALLLVPDNTSVLLQRVLINLSLRKYADSILDLNILARTDQMAQDLLEVLTEFLSAAEIDTQDPQATIEPLLLH